MKDFSSFLTRKIRKTQFIIFLLFIKIYLIIEKAGEMRVVIVLTIIILLCSSLNYPQDNNNKEGGVCFRIDDNHPLSQYSDLAQIFNVYGYNFCFALNLGRIRNSSDFDDIRNLQNEGHELLDHTPDHNTKMFNVSDTTYYSDKLGVDHIYNSTICLSYDYVDTTTHLRKGLVNISGDLIISQNQGEFLYFNDGTNLNSIYISELKKLFDIYQINNSDSNDVDTIFIKSFWDEPVNLGSYTNLNYYKVGVTDVRFSTEALNLLAERTLNICSFNNLLRPYTWIEPGGNFPEVTRSDIERSFASTYNYICGSALPEAVKCFEAYDPLNDNKFGMSWGDFFEDRTNLSQLKTIIADGIARHFVLIGHSHFWDLLGGWQGYLNRMDSLLAWCFNNNIRIKTYSEWSDILYNQKQNPYTNVFPKLDVDLDNNDIPDGYSLFSDVTFDTLDGVEASSFKSLSRKDPGNIFFVDDLGGIEKGLNSFSFWLKGETGTTFNLVVTFVESDEQIDFEFKTQNSQWNKFNISQSINGNTSLNVPDSISKLGILLSCSDNNGTDAKVSGIKMEKYYQSQIVPPWIDSLSFERVVSLHWINNSSECSGFYINRKFNMNDSFDIIDTLPKEITFYEDSLINIPDSLMNSNDVLVYYQIVTFFDSLLSGSDIDSVIVSTNDVLPVELSLFSYKKRGSIIELFWVTETEVNNYGFEIERKGLIRKNEWRKIGFVEGAGNSNSPKKYKFIDKSPYGSRKFAYRLKQIDNNGDYIYSKILEVEIKPIEFSLYQNYPNPFNLLTNIKFSIPKAIKVNINIYNSIGQLIEKLVNKKFEPGYYEVRFDAKNLASGIYFCRIQAGGYVKTRKMVLLK